MRQSARDRVDGEVAARQVPLNRSARDLGNVQDLRAGDAKDLRRLVGKENAFSEAGGCQGLGQPTRISRDDEVEFADRSTEQHVANRAAHHPDLKPEEGRVADGGLELRTAQDAAQPHAISRGEPRCLRFFREVPQRALSYSENPLKSLRIIGMASHSSSPVGPEVVRKVAALARISVPESDLPAWSEQLGRIVSYIDQLKELSEEGIGEQEVGPTPLRPDEPVAGAGLQALEENTRLAHGHGVVPRVVGGGASAQ